MRGDHISNDAAIYNVWRDEQLKGKTNSKFSEKKDWHLHMYIKQSSCSGDVSKKQTHTPLKKKKKTNRSGAQTTCFGKNGHPFGLMPST